MTEQTQYSAGAAYMHGEVVPIADARIPLLDTGFLRSDLTYDVVHLWKGCFFRLEEHLDRFERSVGRLRLKLPTDRDGLRQVLVDLVKRSGMRDACVNMTLTRGVANAGSAIPGYLKIACTRMLCRSSGSLAQRTRIAASA